MIVLGVLDVVLPEARGRALQAHEHPWELGECSRSDPGAHIHIRKQGTDLNSVSIILGVEGWRLLAKPDKVFLGHMATWGLQSCRSP